MKDRKKMLWDLFCATGEPVYYSMYVRCDDDKEPEQPQ